MTHLKKRFLFLFLLFIGIFSDICAISTLLKNDPYPVFTSLDPQEYLYTREKLEIKGFDIYPAWYQKIGLYISPFGQNATLAQDINGFDTMIGDLNTGRWDMIALLYGQTPQCKTLPPLLVTASQVLFPNGENSGLNNPDLIDHLQQFGFFSMPVVYKKRGVRFEFDARVHGDFGFCLQTSVVDICQTNTAQINLTGNDDFKGNSKCNFLSACNVNKYLMEQLKNIAQQICLDINNFQAVNVEEVRLSAWWRHAYPIDQDDIEYPSFLMIPYFQLTGSVSPAKRLNPNKAFGVPFGNNGHSAVGVQGGLCFDFYETIEIGLDLQYTHFFKKHCVEMRVPNNLCQTGIFPFSTEVSIQPGDNYGIAGKLSAYHFLDNLSMYFQYMFIQHLKDKICVLNGDPAYKPVVLEKYSDWKVQLINIGFTYDISPNISLGAFTQIPWVTRRVYNACTLLFSINFTY